MREEDYENILDCGVCVPKELLQQDRLVFQVKPNSKIMTKRLQVFEWLVAGNATSISTPKRPQAHSWIRFEPKTMESTFK